MQQECKHVNQHHATVEISSTDQLNYVMNNDISYSIACIKLV